MWIRLASKIFKDMLRAFNWVANTDHLSFGKKRGFKLLVYLGSQFDFFVLAVVAHLLGELGTKDHR
jgi:hypothetical protein